jgi:hypothetical protein
MAYSYIEYTAGGSNTFNIPFEYINDYEITVFVDGVDTPFTFTSASTVDVSPAPTNGATVRIVRDTDLTTRAVDFASGSVLTEEDMDTSNIQVFNAAQEAIDKANAAISLDADGKWEAAVDSTPRTIKNVANPINNNDAVNLGFLSTNIGAVTNVNANIAKVETVHTNIEAVKSVATDLDYDNDSDTATSSKINIVADSINDVNAYADTYIISATQPSSTVEGAQWYNTTNNTKYIYNGSFWQAYNTSVTSTFVGLRVEPDGRLTVHYGNGSFDVDQYDDWFIGLSDATFEIDSGGNLKVIY